MSVSPKYIHNSCSKSSPINMYMFRSQFDNNFQRRKFSKCASTTTQPSIGCRISGLLNFLNIVDNLCNLTRTQPGVPKGQNHKLVESLLGKSLWLIDVCETIRVVLTQTTERVRQLQSVLRRKADGREAAREFRSYLKSRKMVRKVLLKVLKDADSFRKEVVLASSNESQKINPYICLLKNSFSLSADVLKDSFSYIASWRAPSGTNKWSLISKLVSLRYELLSKEETCWFKKNTFEVVDPLLLMVLSVESLLNA